MRVHLLFSAIVYEPRLLRSPCMHLPQHFSRPPHLPFRRHGMVPSHPPPPAPVFHEHQRMLCCGTHTPNNLYQHKWIDSAAMDKLASSLAAAHREEQSQEKGCWAGVTAAAAAATSSPSSVYESLIPGLDIYDVLVLVEALKPKKAKFAMH